MACIAFTVEETMSARCAGKDRAVRLNLFQNSMGVPSRRSRGPVRPARGACQHGASSHDADGRGGAHLEVPGKSLMHNLSDSNRDFVLSDGTGRRAQRGWKQLLTRNPGLAARGDSVTHGNLDVVRHKRNGATAAVVLDFDEFS
eukprot:4753899-Pleurochrysis_carterae.AAC.5